MATSSSLPSLKVRIRQYAATSCFQVLGFATGAMHAYTSPAIPDMKLANNKFPVSDEQGALIGSILFVGAIFGSLFAGPMTRQLGHKSAMMVNCTVFGTGWLLIIAANSVLSIYFGRIWTGISFGVSLIVSPLYISEIATPDVRGKLMTMSHVANGIGTVYVMCLGVFLHWRWLAVSIQALSVLAMTAISFTPDSPRWCFAQGRLEQGTEALQWLRGEDADITDEVKAIKTSIEMKKAAGPIAIKSLATRSFIMPLIIISTLFLLLQFTGSAVITLNMSEMLAEANVNLDPNVQSVIVTAIELLATIPLMILIDRLGRRIMLMTAFLITAMMLLTLGMSDLLKVHYPEKMTEMFYWLPIVGITIYKFGSNIAVQIPFMLMVEMYPSCVKEVACSITVLVFLASTFIVPSLYIYFVRYVGYYGMYFIFAGFATTGIIFVYLIVPETKKKSLEQLEEMFAKKFRRSVSTTPV